MEIFSFVQKQKKSSGTKTAFTSIFLLLILRSQLVYTIEAVRRQGSKQSDEEEKKTKENFCKKTVSHLLLRIQCSRHSIDNNNDLNSYLCSVMRAKYIEPNTI